MVDVDPHDPTTTSKPEAPMQSLNQLPMVIEPAVKQDQPDHEDQFLQAIEERARIRGEQSDILPKDGVLNSTSKDGMYS